MTHLEVALFFVRLGPCAILIRFFGPYLLCLTGTQVLDLLAETIDPLQLLAGGLQFLRLESSLDDVQRIGSHASQSSGETCTGKIPEVRVASFPGFDQSLCIFIHANHHAHERNVHYNRDRVRPVQASQSLVLHDVGHALRRCQTLA